MKLLVINDDELKIEVYSVSYRSSIISSFIQHHLFTCSEQTSWKQGPGPDFRHACSKTRGITVKEEGRFIKQDLVAAKVGHLFWGCFYFTNQV